jgi:adenosylcobinamide-GDP ribazoletransferase
MILLLFLTTDYVRKQGLASEITKGINRRATTVIVIFIITVGAFASLSSTLCVLLGFLGMRHLMIKRLQGCTGDTSGALVETSEALWLIAATIAL